MDFSNSIQIYPPRCVNLLLHLYAEQLVFKKKYSTALSIFCIGIKTKTVWIFFTSFYFPYISQIQQSTLSTHKGALTQITAAIDNKQSHFVDMDTINYLIVTTSLIQTITVRDNSHPNYPFKMKTGTAQPMHCCWLFSEFSLRGSFLKLKSLLQVWQWNNLHMRYYTTVTLNNSYEHENLFLFKSS